MTPNELIEISGMVGDVASISTTPFSIILILITLLIAIIISSIGFEEEDFYNMTPRYNSFTDRIVPIVEYKDTGSISIKYSEHRKYLSKTDYKWKFIENLREFGWVKQSEPKLTLFMSQGMKEKIDKIFKNSKK